MTSLMDVMFLVLVFFIYCIFDMAVHKGLKVDLPNAAGADEKGERIELPADTSYEEFLQLTHPEMDAEDIQRAVAKDRRYSWMVRFEILAFLLIIVAIVVMVLSS